MFFYYCQRCSLHRIQNWALIICLFLLSSHNGKYIYIYIDTKGSYSKQFIPAQYTSTSVSLTTFFYKLTRQLTITSPQTRLNTFTFSDQNWQLRIALLQSGIKTFNIFPGSFKKKDIFQLIYSNIM